MSGSLVSTRSTPGTTGPDPSSFPLKGLRCWVQSPRFRSRFSFAGYPGRRAGRRARPSEVDSPWWGTAHHTEADGSDIEQRPSMTIRDSRAPSGRRRILAGYGLAMLALLSMGCAGPGGRGGLPSASVPSPATAGASAAASDLSSAIGLAIAEERNARATYHNMIARFGAVAPFRQIAESEANHTAALERLAGAHGIPLPTTSGSGAAAPGNLREACQIGRRR